MRSIENLREYVLTAPSICSTTRAILVGYIDEIEREVADMVPLPVDADGVPIHVGDMVTMDLMFSGKSKPLVVDRMELSRGKDGNLWCVALDTDEACWNQPSLLHHHHAPTVEDVLREFYVYAERGKEHHREDVDDAVLAEYAARLRLAGDE